MIWASKTAPLGWDMKGIWPVGSDGSQINAVDVSRGRGVVQTVATGDSEGPAHL